jgi:hypothetical protein
MTKIIKLKQGDSVPSGAKFLYAKDEQELTGIKTVIYDDVFTVFTLGLAGSAVRRIPQYRAQTYFFYEVET